MAHWPVRIAWLVAAAGCSGPGTSNLPADLHLSTEALDFGEVPTDSRSRLDITLTNEGDEIVEVLSATLDAGDHAVWSVDRDEVDALGWQEYTVVTVTFNPQVDGQAETGSVKIRTSWQSDPTLAVSLAGLGGTSSADEDGDGYPVNLGDCDDSDPDVHPFAEEKCDGIDNDCDGEIPDDEADGDGDGWLVCADDCDDGDASVHPGARERCDGIDNDCDGADPADETEDADGDGVSVCEGDCDDDDAGRTPGRTEDCDGVDDDCNDVVDDLDLDGDGHSPCDVGGDCDDVDASAYPVLVDADSASSGDGTAKAPYRELSDALAHVATTCREVLVLPGTYAVAETWETGEVTITGMGADVSEVVLTAAGGRLFDVGAGTGLALVGLTLEGGAAVGPGGAIRATDADLSLSGVVAQGNASESDGGAVAVFGGSISVADTWFVSNSAGGAGGAVSVDGATSLFIERTAFWLNDAGTVGGGLSIADIDDGASVVRNLVVQDNGAANSGGGIAVSGDSVAFVLANSTLVSNTASGDGAGIFVDAADATGLYLWSNLVGGSAGDSGLYVTDGNGASVAHNLAWATS